MVLFCFLSESSPVDASAISLAFIVSEIPCLMGSVSTYKIKKIAYINKCENVIMERGA